MFFFLFWKTPILFRTLVPSNGIRGKCEEYFQKGGNIDTFLFRRCFFSTKNNVITGNHNIQFLLNIACCAIKNWHNCLRNQFANRINTRDSALVSGRPITRHGWRKAGPSAFNNTTDHKKTIRSRFQCHFNLTQMVLEWCNPFKAFPPLLMLM